MITHVPPATIGPTDLHTQIFNPDEWTNKLNLGCGNNYLEGFINLDVNPKAKPDIICNLDDPNVKLPFKDGEIDFIYASHIFEHIRYLPELKLELDRITRFPGGLVVIVPYYLSRCAWSDDTHVRAFSELSFNSQFWPGWKYLNHQIIDMNDVDGGVNQWLIGCFGKLKPEV